MDKTPVKIKKRMLILLSIFVGLFIFMITRLYHVQVVEGATLQERAFDQHTRDRNITPTRGDILDVNGNLLATSASVFTIGVVRAQVEDPEYVASVLAEKLGKDYEEVYKKVTKHVAFERIATKVDKELADSIRLLNLPGVKVDGDSQRYYPYENLAAHALGFVGKDNQGIVGLEVKYDEYLKGAPGKILMQTNGKGEREVSEAEIRIDPINGHDLVTTIDVTLQQYAQQAIDSVVAEKQAKGGTIVLMNPNDGAIYAMANSPSFNLNDPFTVQDPEVAAMWSTLDAGQKQTELNEMWRNFAINDTYEPGSTFKIVTSAIGLSEGVVTPTTPFVCNGYHMVEGVKIKCWRSSNPHGYQTFTQGVQNSCNPVFMMVGDAIGALDFYQYMADMGLMRKTGIDLPGEARGVMHKEEKIGPVELATISFGQSFQITPIQLLSAASATINGGKQIIPHFGKYLLNEAGQIIREFDYTTNNQIVSPEVSEQMKTILESVVADGTGNKSYIPGYKIGGKTATSQKLPRGSGKYIASFLAFAPADDPKVIAIVLIDEPKGVYYGGTIAGPVMKEVLANALPYLGIEPKYTKKELTLLETQTYTVPKFVELKIQEAKSKAYRDSVTLEIIGEGDTVIDQFPAEGEIINKTSKIILYT
ncbi:penicillin-binding transpeptidase domain-containing protein [Candidatus Epulonipiscium viviparus]|uniref:penicillin-binding transpeptidase domain-containing protein n=1 Tax=Candidatus Epulonipiscium viviparus TaxID=420336 RepID=UPI0004966AA2|nr:penicillin-binding transpeptidase domain-containing protein [Candidatus Epulopiscium viviparus]